MLRKPKLIPNQPGVYFFRDQRGRILYIGKAASLRQRLTSYFSKSAKDPRLAAMLGETARIEWQETDSEIETLIRESQLIKQHRTPYNILLRDDKQYAYVVFTDEEFSKVFVTHQPGKLKTIGPFTESWGLKETLKLLRRVFPYCTCKQLHNNYCLNYHIGKCLGFCCLKKTADSQELMDYGRKEYQKNIRAIGAILSGKKQGIARRLKQEMKATGKAGDFVRAIQLRGQLARLKRVLENARVIQQLAGRENGLAELQSALGLKQLPRRIECYDVANIQSRYATGAMAVFTDGQPDKDQYRKFRIQAKAGGDTAMLEEILRRRFAHPEWPVPDLIVVDGGKAQLNVATVAAPAGAAAVALTKDQHHRGDHIFVATQSTPLKLSALPPAASVLLLQIDAEAHRFAIMYYRKLHRRAIPTR